MVLELIIDRELTAIFQSRGRGMHKVKKEKAAQLCNNEEVQFIWSMISPSSIEEESVCQDLLREIAFMWVTTRGHSKAQMKLIKFTPLIFGKKGTHNKKICGNRNITYINTEKKTGINGAMYNAFVRNGEHFRISP